MIRIFPFLAAALLVFICSLPVTARPHSTPVLSLENSLIEVEVVDSAGLPQEIVLRRGRLVTDLDEGETYGLRLTNKSDRRVRVVVSVDRTNPKDGTRAYRGQSGVVIAPGASLVLDSGRRSRRDPMGPLLPLNPEVGAISLLSVREAGSYPMMGIGYPPAPRGPENYRVDESGERVWVPPHDYPFRRDRGGKEENIYMEYMLVPAISAP